MSAFNHEEARSILSTEFDSGTFARRRDTSHYGASKYFPTREHFFQEECSEGLNTVNLSGRELDFWVSDRNSTETIVSFHGNLSPRQRTIPYLTGRGFSQSVDANLIAISDPSLSLGAISIAWFLGDRKTGPLPAFLEPFLNRIISQFPRSKNIWFFGGSGGAFAAINFALHYGNCSALVFNPRLDLSSLPRAPLAMSSYLRYCHGARTKTAMLRIKSDFFEQDLSRKWDDGLNVNLFIVHNSNDGKYLRNQVRPFLHRTSGSSKVYLNLFDGPDGHKPPSADHLAAAFKSAKSLRDANSTEESELFQFPNTYLGSS